MNKKKSITCLAFIFGMFVQQPSQAEVNIENQWGQTRKSMGKSMGSDSIDYFIEIV